MNNLTVEQLAEKRAKIDQIYSHAIAELEKLAHEKDEIIREYTRRLEQEKIEALRAHLSGNYSTN